MKINILSLKFKQLLLVLILPVFCFSQKDQDSLLDIWKNKKLSDSSRANAYNKYISKNFEENKTDSAYIFVTELIKFTEDNKLASQKANALITLGNIQYIVGDYSKAIKNYTKSLDFYLRENNKKGEVRKKVKT